MVTGTTIASANMLNKPQPSTSRRWRIRFLHGVWQCNLRG
jgi:hypothetical protein